METDRTDSGRWSELSLPELVAELRSGKAHAPGVEAVGWATVDLERARQETGLGAGWLPIDEPALGARGVRTTLGSIDLVLLEPSTEGRLAGWLARHGESVAVEYRNGRARLLRRDR